jgi:hypothetical protein
MVSDNICDNTGTSASIYGTSGADNWNVDGNMVDVATNANSGAGWTITDEKVI